MNVGGFSEHQDRRSDTNGYEGCFFTARISQVNMKTTKKISKQRFELQIAKCLVVQLLSNSYNASSPELRINWKATQRGSRRVANDIVLNQVRVYHERVYADKVVSKFWFVRSSSSQHYSNFNPTVLPKMYSTPAIKYSRPDLSFAR